MQSLWRALAVAAVLGLTASAAQAHPHIWVDAQATVDFNAAGELTAIHNRWTFDEAFSVWQVQGLDTDGDGVTSSEEMQDLADENLQGLAEYGFYTLAGVGEESIHFQALGPAKFVFENNRSTLSFSIAPEQPYAIEGRFELAIADPEYYVAITYAGQQDLTLAGAPPGCTLGMDPPRELSPDIMARLGDLSADVTKLPADLEAAVRGAQGAFVLDCPHAAAPASTALDAVTQVAETRPSLPFGGPPQEPGFTLPKTGLLGWVAKTQAEFYVGLTAALGRLKSDWTAFWVLGGLSFLYGVFHAAGPGHGKVVIGSYMLANERQVRRGIGLSFAAGLLQSAVAVLFVGVAAALLGLSAAVMNDAVGWVEKASYALIALLGAWLVARRLLGRGHVHPAPDLAAARFTKHSTAPHAPLGQPQALHFEPAPVAAAGVLDAHGRAPGDAHYGLDHGDAPEHDHHHHVVTADQTGGDWREQLGVVVSVGLRPCTGALLVLMFALSQGAFLAGVAATFLMGLGTAITVSVLAVIAVGAKDLARRYLDLDGALGGRLIWWAELVGAMAVLVFGLTLLLASL